MKNNHNVDTLNTFEQSNGTEYRIIDSLKDIFEENELGVMAAAFNGCPCGLSRDEIDCFAECISEAIEFEGLDRLWDADGPQLVEKLVAADDSVIVGLITYIQFFWESAEYSFGTPYEILEAFEKQSVQPEKANFCSLFF